MSAATVAARAADRLVRRLGGDAVLRKPGTGTFSTSTGTVTNAAPTDYAVVAHSAPFEASLIDGARVRTGDRRITVTAENVGTTPAVGWTFFDGSDPTAAPAWSVIDVSERRVAGEPISYVLQVRR